jgi:hypothetical protein
MILRHSMLEAARRLPTRTKSARCGSPLEGEDPYRVGVGVEVEMQRGGVGHRAVG